MQVHILHLHSTFALGGKEARAVRLMNAFGDRVRHVVVSAVPRALQARDAIDPAIDVSFRDDFPPLAGPIRPARLLALARAMRGHDLVLTYNWGAMDAVMARRLFGRALGLPPLVHHEDGFNADEAAGELPRRRLYRRLALGGADALAVPSTTLERLARASWGRAATRIGNGVPIARYAVPPQANAIPGLERRQGELVVGTLAGLRAVKNLPRLVRAVAMAGAGLRLVIVGEGPERAAIAAEAARVGIADRLVMPGFLADPARYVGLFDIFALSSDSEQAPISLIEAMAAGRPVVATDVGDVAAMLPPDARRFVVPPDDGEALAAALRTLRDDAGLRDALGSANRAHATAVHDEAAMIAGYAGLYSAAIGLPGRFG